MGVSSLTGETSLLFVSLLLLVGPHFGMEGSSTMASISVRHSKLEVYPKLIDVANQLKEMKQSPRPIVVFTDVGKDYDDLAALLVLKEFHRLQLVELRAVVANLMPAEKRARFARAVLDSLGLRHVPVACGTRGSPEDHEELKYELEFNEVESGGGDSVASEDVPLEEGQALLLKVYENAKENGEKLYLLCLSSLQDIHEFASNHSDLVANYTAEVYMQGGNYISEEGKLEPDCKAANNLFNLDAAKSWYTFIQAHAIPSRTYTKSVAFAAPLSSDVFVELEATGHPIGAYLRRVQVEQDLAFYERACESDSEKRFAPFMDQEWFLSNKTNWPLRPTASDADALPKGKEVIPYLTKIVLYDVHAALGIAGDDLLAELGVLESKGRSTGEQGEGVKEPHHWISDNDLSSAVAENVCLVTPNLYRTVVANTAAAIAGGTGVMPGGNVGADHAILEQGASAGNVGNERFETGKTANPTALLLLSAMMQHLQFPSFADRLEQAVKSMIAEGTYRTEDLGGTSSTQDVLLISQD